MDKKVLCLLLFALVLRLAGMSFFLPYDGIHPRENFTISHSINYLTTGNLKPYDFQHPTFGQYLITFFSFLAFLPQFISSREVFVEHVISNYALVYLIGRILSVLASFLAVFVVYLAGVKLKDRMTGFFAALFIGSNFLAIKFAHYVTPDSLALLFVSLSLLYALFVFKGLIFDHLIVCGLFSGFALGSKFSGFISLGYFFIAYIFFLKKKGPGLKFLLLPILAIFIGFFLSSPFHIISFKEFLRDAGNYLAERGFAGVSVSSLRYSGLFEYPFVLIPLGFSAFGYIFFYVGSIMLFVKRERFKFILIVLPLVVYFLALSKERAATPRNVLLTLPSLSLGAAYFFSWLRDKKLYKTLIFLVIIALSLQVAKAIVFDCFLFKKDTRILAKEWITNNIDKQKSIAFEPYTPLDLNQIERSNLTLFYDTAYIVPSLAVNPPRFYREKGFDYIVTSGVREREYSFNCQRERSCLYADNYSSFAKEFELVAQFRPPKIFNITAFPFWGIWPHNPTVKIYRVK